MKLTLVFCSWLQSDYHFEYTECDVLGSRWRVAVPNKADTCTGLPDPVKGTQCSECPTSHSSSFSAFSAIWIAAAPHFILSVPRHVVHITSPMCLSFPIAAFSCSEGEFLDMRSQQCQKCAAGTYSLGTGVAFDEWDSLPPGFVTHGANTNGGDAHTDCSKLAHASLFYSKSRCLGFDRLKLSLS